MITLILEQRLDRGHVLNYLACLMISTLLQKFLVPDVDVRVKLIKFGPLPHYPSCDQLCFISNLSQETFPQ